MSETTNPDFEAADRWAKEPWLPAGLAWDRDFLENAALAYLTLKDEVIDHEQTERALRAELAAEKAARERAEARVMELTEAGKRVVLECVRWQEDDDDKGSGELEREIGELEVILAREKKESK